MFEFHNPEELFNINNLFIILYETFKKLSLLMSGLFEWLTTPFYLQDFFIFKILGIDLLSLIPDNVFFDALNGFTPLNLAGAVFIPIMVIKLIKDLIPLL